MRGAGLWRRGAARAVHVGADGGLGGLGGEAELQNHNQKGLEKGKKR